MVKLSLKSTFGFNNFPLDIRHVKFPGHFYFYWHANLFDQITHFTLNQPQQWCESLPKLLDDGWVFLNSKPNCNGHFQSSDLDGGPRVV
jgi:hypothetical protein